MVWSAVLESPRLTATQEQLAGPRVEHAPQCPQDGVEGGPGVPDRPQVLPDPAGTNPLLVALEEQACRAEERGGGEGNFTMRNTSHNNPYIYYI